MDIVLSPAPIGQDIVQTVSARDLHERLGLVKPFADWIKVQLRDPFKQGVDFEVFHPEVINSGRGRPSVEYVLTLECAKHIALMSRTDQGRAIRDYFIALERRALSAQAPQPAAALPVEHEGALEALQDSARGMAAAKVRYSEASEAMRAAQWELDYQKDRFETASSWYVAAVGRNLSRAIAAPEACIGLQPLKLEA